VHASAILQESIVRLRLHWRYGEGALPLKILQAARRSLWYRREMRVYVYPAEAIASLPDTLILNRDRIDDLRYYERTDPTQAPPGAYRETARARLRNGDHLYTLVEGNRLLHYGWIQPDHERGEDRATGQVFFPLPGAVSLYDFYTHPRARGRGLYFKSICHLLHESVSVLKAERAYIYVAADNGPSRHVIEKVGFRWVGSLVKEGRLRAVRRYALSGGGEFRAALL
jgi:RimJ/RimL family protein N-acetyltransferase